MNTKQLAYFLKTVELGHWRGELTLFDESRTD